VFPSLVSKNSFLLQFELFNVDILARNTNNLVISAGFLVVPLGLPSLLNGVVILLSLRSSVQSWKPKFLHFPES